MRSTGKIGKAYVFFTEKEKKGEMFTLEDLANSTGWKQSTIESYITKKWSQFVTKETDGKLRVKGISDLPERVFIKMHSQKAELFLDPARPELPGKVETLVQKSREAALLAVQIYNNPTSMFRTHGFIVFITIAWTSIFHAYFESKGQEYYYRDDKGNYILNESGEKRAWDIRKCLKVFYGSHNCAEKANLEFLVELRDRIEHRYLPAIDTEIVGECQAALLNYEAFLVSNFSDYFALNQSLAFSLQFSTTQTKQQIIAKKRLQSKEYDDIRMFIKQFRANLQEDIFTKPEYCFRVFLVPILGNHAKSADHSIQFIKYDPENQEEMEQYEKDVVFIKSRLIPAVNINTYLPSKVAELVSTRIGKVFRVIPEHVKAWKMYKVRPRERTPEGCKTEFCLFDVVHKDFVYTQAWVDFLTEKLQDDGEYEKLVNYKES